MTTPSETAPRHVASSQGLSNALNCRHVITELDDASFARFYKLYLRQKTRYRSRFFLFNEWYFDFRRLSKKKKTSLGKLEDWKRSEERKKNYGRRLTNNYTETRLQENSNTYSMYFLLSLSHCSTLFLAFRFPSMAKTYERMRITDRSRMFGIDLPVITPYSVRNIYHRRFYQKHGA